MNTLGNIAAGLEHLFFPHVCEGCGTDILAKNQKLCLYCLQRLPLTNFQHYAGNPVEKIFWGRIELVSAASFLYFTKGSLLQHLLHEFKYRNNREIGFFLGKLMGNAFRQSERFAKIDGLVALPLFAAKERKRGYNQAAVLCEGFCEATGIPFLDKAVLRKTATETQTHKNRLERWQNMEGRFEVEKWDMLRNKNVLLIDDVVTTGATLEACGQELLKVPGLLLNIATLAYTST
jgi:ComF family protein